MWTYIHTPGIHTYVELIYADYAMVYQKTRTTPNITKGEKEKKKWGQKYISKATSIRNNNGKQKEGTTSCIVHNYWLALIFPLWSYIKYII